MNHSSNLLFDNIFNKIVLDFSYSNSSRMMLLLLIFFVAELSIQGMIIQNSAYWFIRVSFFKFQITLHRILLLIFIVSSLECYLNDGDDQSLSICQIRNTTTGPRYCYYKTKLIISDVERGCALGDGFDEADDDIFIAPTSRSTSV